MSRNYIDRPEEKFYPNGNIYTRTYSNDNAERRLHRDPIQGPAYEQWYDNGIKANQQYFVDGKRHRDPSQGPAFEAWDGKGNKYAEHYYVDGKAVSKPEAKVDINMEVKPKERFYPNGNIKSRSYYNATGQFHRDPIEGPAYEEWYSNGQKRLEAYYMSGRRHRDPLEVKPEEKFFPNGQISTRIYKNAAGKLHRDPLKGPAQEYWFENGQKSSECYFVDGELHRDPKEGPAVEYWHKNGQKTSTYYFVDGKKHREPSEGPASEHWSIDGVSTFEYYYVDGKLAEKPKKEERLEVKPDIESDNSTAIIATSLILAAICGALKQKNSTKKYSKFLDTNEKFANVEITTKQCAR